MTSLFVQLMTNKFSLTENEIARFAAAKGHMNKRIRVHKFCSLTGDFYYKIKSVG